MASTETVYSVMATVSDQHVEDDTVEYFVFPALSNDAGVVDQLEELRVECFSLLNELSRSYIWHHDGINLVTIHEGKTTSHKNHCALVALVSRLIHRNLPILL